MWCCKCSQKGSNFTPFFPIVLFFFFLINCHFCRILTSLVQVSQWSVSCQCSLVSLKWVFIASFYHVIFLPMWMSIGKSRMSYHSALLCGSATLWSPNMNFLLLMSARRSAIKGEHVDPVSRVCYSLCPLFLSISNPSLSNRDFGVGTLLKSHFITSFAHCGMT